MDVWEISRPSRKHAIPDGPGDREQLIVCKLSSLCDKLTGLSVMRGTQEGQFDLKASIVCVKFQDSQVGEVGGLQNPR